MDKIDTHYLVPVHEAGIQKDIHYSVTAEDTDDAQDWFIDAKERLLNVNSWNNYNQLNELHFELTDKFGIPADRNAHKGDHIQMNTTDNRYYWALIEAIEYDDYPDTGGETIAIHLRPARNPQENSDSIEMLSKNSFTSTLVIERRGKVLMAIYHSRNEASGNAILAYDDANMWPMLTDAQWKNIISSFIEAEKA